MAISDLRLDVKGRRGKPDRDSGVSGAPLSRAALG